MEFLPLSRRRSSARNVPSCEERGETDAFAGYYDSREITKWGWIHLQHARRTVAFGKLDLFIVLRLKNSTKIPAGKCDSYTRMQMNPPWVNAASTKALISIQLFRERLSGKVHATILKGIVGGFEFSFFQKNLKELARKAMEMCLQVENLC